MSDPTQSADPFDSMEEGEVYYDTVKEDTVILKNVTRFSASFYFSGSGNISTATREEWFEGVEDPEERFVEF